MIGFIVFVLNDILLFMEIEMLSKDPIDLFDEIFRDQYDVPMPDMGECIWSKAAIHAL